MKLLICVCLLLSIVVTSSVAATQESDLARVSGRVTDLRGFPLEDVEVQFFELEGIRGVSAKEMLVKTVVTDEQGNYKVSGLPAGQYRVNVEARGFGHTEVWRFYLWRNAHRVLDIGVPIGYTHSLVEISVIGQVRMTNGAPLEEATVRLVNAYDPGEEQQVRTNRLGKYKIDLVQPGQYIVYVIKPGYAVSTATVDLGNGAQRIMNFILRPMKRKPLMMP
jgi:protocatechuate 3,4-dioxygenase beta subunit